MLGGRRRHYAFAGVVVLWHRNAMLALFAKSLIGALAVLLIALASRSRVYWIAGLVPLFPTFALIAHVIVGTERTAAELRATALFGLWSLLPYAVYLAVVYAFATRWPLGATLVTATLAWCAAAAVLIVVWQRVYPAV